MVEPRKINKRATLSDVSRATGVSVSSVSRILNDTDARLPYAEKTRELVLGTAQDLGYLPNFLARSNRNSRTGQVGIVAPFLRNAKGNIPFYHAYDYITGIMEIIEPHGLNAVLIPKSDFEGEEPKPLRIFSETFIDGAIVTARIPTQYHERMKKVLMNMVVWCDANERNPQNCLWRDERSAGMLTIRHLQTRQGKVVWIERDDSKLRTADFLADRREGAVLEAQKRNLELRIEKISCSDNIDMLDGDMLAAWIRQGYELATSEYAFGLQAYTLPTARHLVPGRDFYLSCADDLDLHGRYCPELSRASFDRLQMGRDAARMLVNRLNNSDVSTPSSIQPVHWIPGTTAGKVK